MLYLKIHESYRKVVALCDKDLAGKYFEEGIRQLDVRESFYKDKEMNAKEVIELLQQLQLDYATFNIVGPEAVAIAKEAGIIGDEHTSEVAGIPFALTLV